MNSFSDDNKCFVILGMRIITNLLTYLFPMSSFLNIYSKERKKKNEFLREGKDIKERRRTNEHTQNIEYLRNVVETFQQNKEQLFKNSYMKKRTPINTNKSYANGGTKTKQTIKAIK